MFEGYISNFRLLSPNVKIFLAGNAIQAFGLSIYTLLFNLYLKELGFGESSIGNLISTSSLGIAVMAIPASLFVEKFHVKHLVALGMFVSTVLYLFQVQFTSEVALFSLGLFASMFQALFNISVSPFYLRNSTPNVRMHLFTLNSALVMVANFFGYFSGGFLPQVLEFFTSNYNPLQVYRASLMVALVVMFSSNFMFLKIKKVPIPKNKKKLIDGLKEKEWSILGKLILPKLCFAFGGGLIVPFMNLYLKEKFDLSTQMIGISYALLQLFIFLGIFVTPSLVKKTTPLKFIMITSVFSIPFMILMGMTGNIGIVLSCFFLRGMLMNMSSPITSMFEMEKVREHECVFASAMILFFYNLVYTSSTRIGGHLIENFSFGTTFYLAASFYGAAIILYYKFFKNEEKAKPEAPVEYKEAA